jgi:hypothetical protein
VKKAERIVMETWLAAGALPGEKSQFALGPPLPQYSIYIISNCKYAAYY